MSNDTDGTEQQSPVKVLDGVEFRPDKNGIYRNAKGHVMKGSNLAGIRAKRKRLKDKLHGTKPADLRAYINKNLESIIDVLIDAAVKDRDTLAAKLLLDKVLPSLRSVDMSVDVQQMPTMIIHQLQQGRTIEGQAEAARLSDAGGTPVPHFSERDNLYIPTPDNFPSNRNLESTSSPAGDDSSYTSISRSASTGKILFEVLEEEQGDPLFSNKEPSNG